MVAVQNIYVDENCQVVVGPVEFVDPADLPSGPEGLDTAVFSAESATARGARDVAADGGVSTEASDAGGGGGSCCCWKAYSVQRTWDCCNLLLNEYWMDQYQHCTNICSSYIRTYNAVDGGKWKGPYWSRNSSDHYLKRTGGGLYYTWVTFEGHQGYSYRGPFDWTGTYFYNSYTTQIRGNAMGGWVCDMSWYWRTTFAGWHDQIWCGIGYYGEK
jgi:hypothetical protein